MMEKRRNKSFKKWFQNKNEKEMNKKTTTTRLHNGKCIEKKRVVVFAQSTVFQVYVSIYMYVCRSCQPRIAWTPKPIQYALFVKCMCAFCLKAIFMFRCHRASRNDHVLERKNGIAVYRRSFMGATRLAYFILTLIHCVALLLLLHFAEFELNARWCERYLSLLLLRAVRSFGFGIFYSLICSMFISHSHKCVLRCMLY